MLPFPGQFSRQLLCDSLNGMNMSKLNRNNNGIENSDDLQRKLLKSLEAIDRPAKYCCFGERNFMMPGIEIKRHGQLSLPLSKSHAKELINLCQQAPYGKGTDTVVDTTVRKVWELDATQFKFTNRKWKPFVASVLVEVQAELGLDSHTLSAEPYKLLIYEKGGFFLPHRDGEKLDGMVGTLVICLPTKHDGGELVVSHNGKQQKIRMSGAASGLEISFAAFYADCEHEVKPLVSGHRVCLTYNIVLKPSKQRTSKNKSRRNAGTKPGKRKTKSIQAPDFESTTSRIQDLLEQTEALLEEAYKREDPDTSNAGTDAHEEFDETADRADGVLAIALEHQYSEKGLSIDLLKGADQARAETLFAAAERAGWVAHLGLLTRWEHGSAYSDEDQFGYGRRGGGYYDDSYDEEDEDEETQASDGAYKSQYTMEDVFDEGLSVSSWRDRSDKKVHFGEIHLNESEIVSSTPFNEWKITKEDFEGYTGNAGMTLERWYHRAAVVIWPRSVHFDVLCNAGTGTAIGGLHVMTKSLSRVAKSKREAAVQEATYFAFAIIGSWQPKSQYGWTCNSTAEEVERELFCESLIHLNNTNVVRRYLGDVVAVDPRAPISSDLLKSCQQLGWNQFEEEFATLFQPQTNEMVERNAGIILQISQLRQKNDQCNKLCRKLASRLVDSLVKTDEQAEAKRTARLAELRKRDYFDGMVDDNYLGRQADNQSKLLVTLVKAFLKVETDKPLKKLLRHMLSASWRYDLTETHLASAFKLEKSLPKLAAGSNAIGYWLKECRKELKSRTKTKPRPPQDQRRNSEVPCDCADCKLLSQFLDNPDQSSTRMPLAKNRRKHLHRIIDGNRLDCLHVTERTGRPYTMVITKTMTSHQLAFKIYQRDLKNLARIEKLIAIVK